MEPLASRPWHFACGSGILPVALWPLAFRHTVMHFVILSFCLWLRILPVALRPLAFCRTVMHLVILSCLPVAQEFCLWPKLWPLAFCRTVVHFVILLCILSYCRDSEAMGMKGVAFYQKGATFCWQGASICLAGVALPFRGRSLLGRVHILL